MNELLRHFGVERVPEYKDLLVHLRDGRILKAWNFLTLVVDDVLSGDDKPEVIYLRECHIPGHQKYSELGVASWDIWSLKQRLLGSDETGTILPRSERLDLQLSLKETAIHRTFFSAFCERLVRGEMGYIPAQVTDADLAAVKDVSTYMRGHGFSGSQPQYTLLKFVPA